MCEVIRKNFEENYPQIIDDLHSSLFISIDCEFTGIFDDDKTCSLFDSPKVRFNKLQKCLEKYIIIQFGISTFKYERRDNSITSSTYTFYLTPTHFGEDRNFMCRAQSIEFLCKHNFDFNKSFYDGIYYLNKADETKALQMIEDGSIIPRDYQNEIQRHCSTINEWSLNVTGDNEMFLEVDNKRDPLVCLIHLEIRKRFPTLWTYFEKDGIKVKKVSESEKRELNKDEIILKKKLFDSLLGFSRIMKEIQNLKKPIVGHNFLIDLIKIYQQFYNPNPVSYAEFKRAMNNLFPNIYDTKYMSYKLRDILKREQNWKSNCLSDLYQYLRNGKGSILVLFSPLIKHKHETYQNKGDFHEAGFDSYITGFCFSKMAHTFSLWNVEKNCFQQTSMPTTSAWLLGAVSQMKNRLNISRAQVNYIVTDGPDPRNTQRGLLYIQFRKSKPLPVEQLSEMIAKYGSADIQPINKFSALVAVVNQRQLNEVLQSLQNTDDFVISKYNFLRHSFLGRMILSGVITASSVLAAIIILKNWKQV